MSQNNLVCQNKCTVRCEIHQAEAIEEEAERESRESQFIAGNLALNGSGMKTALDVSVEV